MRRATLTLIIVLTSFLSTSGFGCAPLPVPMVPRSEVDRELRNRATENHVLIQVVIADRETGIIIGMGHGSGMIIDYDAITGTVYVATARHVAESWVPEDRREEFVEMRAALFERDGEPYPVTVEALSDDSDSAIVSFLAPSGKLIRPVPIATTLPEQGDILFTVGSPNSAFGIMAFGHVAGECRNNLECNDFCLTGSGCYLIDRPLWPGSSGCGVVNNRGEFIGVVAGLNFMTVGDIVDPALVIFVGAEHIVPLLSSVHAS